MVFPEAAAVVVVVVDDDDDDDDDVVPVVVPVVGREVARCSIGFVELVVEELVVDEVDDTELVDFTTG